MKKIAIVVKNDEKAWKKADELYLWLKSRDIEVIRKESIPPSASISKLSSYAQPDLYCVFVLGGDGTFLSAVRWIGDQRIPILGVKFGEVGFLSEITEDSLFEAVEAILNGQFTISERMRLQVEVLRNDHEPIREAVLNDLVINKRALARLASIETYINDHFLTTYKADGLIIATPTGSTAYSLAAGGPVIHPSVQGIIMTPICPFTLTNRPLIVPDSVCIKIKLESKVSDILLTFDGQSGLEINDKDIIFVRKSIHPVYMMNLPGKDYFDVLKSKLRWSGGRF